MNHVFSQFYYWKYEIPNFDEVLDYCKDYKIDNSKYDWGDACIVDRAPLDPMKVKSLIRPSITLLAKEVNKNMKYAVADAWLSLYNQNSFQEAHDHCAHTLSAVMFLNHGPNFAKFYFADRLPALGYHLQNILPREDTEYPEVKAGDIIIFPSYMMHGVTPHKSDEVRVTLACNIHIYPPDQPSK